MKGRAFGQGGCLWPGIEVRNRLCSGNCRAEVARAYDAREAVSRNEAGEASRPQSVVSSVFLAKVIGLCPVVSEKLQMVCNQDWPGLVVQAEPSSGMQRLDSREPGCIWNIIQKAIAVMQASSFLQQCCVLINLRTASSSCQGPGNCPGSIPQTSLSFIACCRVFCKHGFIVHFLVGSDEKANPILVTQYGWKSKSPLLPGFSILSGPLQK